MSKQKQLNVRMDQELYNAIEEVSKAEGMSKTDVVLPILRDVFLDQLVTRVVRVPVVGYVVSDEEMGNVVIMGGER